MHPNLYIIAGPNGAGKTTFAREFLPRYADCKQFINADLIASGLAPFSPETAAMRAGRLLLEQIRLFAEKKSDFGFETTLSGVAYAALLHRMKTQGYRIQLYFLWIPNVALSLQRIADRVKRGGHYIPKEVVRRRFHKGLYNLFNLYRPILDSWTILDNSEISPRPIASEELGELQVVESQLFEKISEAVKRR